MLKASVGAFKVTAVTRDYSYDRLFFFNASLNFLNLRLG